MAKKPKESDTDQQLFDDIRNVAMSGAGRRLLYYVLSMGNIYSTSFTGNSETFYKEGRRAMALELLDLINDADPNLYIKLQQEQGGTDG